MRRLPLALSLAALFLAPTLAQAGDDPKPPPAATDTQDLVTRLRERLVEVQTALERTRRDLAVAQEAKQGDRVEELERRVGDLERQRDAVKTQVRLVQAGEAPKVDAPATPILPGEIERLRAEVAKTQAALVLDIAKARAALEGRKQDDDDDDDGDDFADEDHDDEEEIRVVEVRGPKGERVQDKVIVEVMPQETVLVWPEGAMPRFSEGQGPPGRPGAGGPPGADDIRRQAKMAALQAALEQARAAKQAALARGAERAAHEAEEKIHAVETLLASLKAGKGPDARGMKYYKELEFAPQGPGGRRPPQGPPMPPLQGKPGTDVDPQRRVEALRQAARTLAQAGMGDRAEALAREANELQQALERKRGGQGGDVGAQLGQLREEIAGLRQEVRRLREVVERLAK